ncbi:hypothetical protein [Peribacillus frigoritolerans]|uniref:Uncharacterized protein n=1 Tax=Peribacillus castrilensis TaxID=2897690 RepID=A0AAW9NJ35_9BACI|nr:hypothetical protein [Peribacillus castrilensis]
MANLPMLPFGLSKFNQQKIEQLANRVIVFVIPARVKSGVQPNEIRFPWKGDVVDVYATCRVPGEIDYTLLKVQKISVQDFNETSTDPIGWVDIAQNCRLDATARIVTPSMTLVNTAVNPNDHFRVIVDELDDAIRDITLEITIKTDFLD